MKTVLRTVVLLLTLLMALSFSVISFADGSEEPTAPSDSSYVILDLAGGDITITETDFTVGLNDSVNWSGNYQIKYTDGDKVEGQTSRLKIQGTTCRILFDNVFIPASRSAIVIEKESDITLILRGDNSVVFTDPAKTGTAISVSNNSKLTIEAESGTDSLNVVGGQYGAGIGSPQDSYEVGAQIVINSGVITATAGRTTASEGCGIGGARNSGAQVTINGGVIHATGLRNAPAIGAGRESPEGSTVTINGGVIFAEALTNSAGIGGGFKSNAKVVINGGIVTAMTKTTTRFAIGRGVDHNGPDTVEINGGSVLALLKNKDNEAIITAKPLENATNSDETPKAVVQTAVTLPAASDYVYLDDQPMFLTSHEENSNTYYFYFAEGSAHTLKFGTYSLTATAGETYEGTAWITGESVAAPEPPKAPEPAVIVTILPSEIPEETPEQPDSGEDDSTTTESKPSEPGKTPESTANGTQEQSPTGTDAPSKPAKRGCKSAVSPAGAWLLVGILAGMLPLCIVSRKRKQTH